MAVKFYVDINKVLDRKGITLTQLSDKTGIDIASLSRMKKTKTATLKTLNKLASGLNETDLDGLVSAEIKNSGEIKN
ncbi:helix-turn-helix domain-containing protein [Alteribacillus sp. HJP-4]|uniref:helix-turn-helix domain-containing protein n=1 Tax=Alteribacillus sp. HJP-4 TaxID=2775394 RepID=UPI0035CCCE37